MDLINFPDGFRPNGSDFLLRETKKAIEFQRLRQQIGRGIVDGLTLARQSDGSVVLAVGHGNDGSGNAVVVAQSAVLDLRGVSLPTSGKFRAVAVCLEYKQEDKGQASGVAGAWAQKIDSYTVKFIEGAEADSEAGAVRPVNRSTALRIGDILYGDNGTRSVSAVNAEYLSVTHQTLGMDIDLSPAKFKKYLARENLSALLRDFPEMFNALSEYWIEGQAYAVSQIKSHNGIQYYCTTGNTATTANTPGKSGAPWVAYELWQRDKNIPIGFIYLNKTDKTNPAALANPWPGTWAALRANDYLAIQGGRYALNTQYEDGLPNAVGSFETADHDNKTIPTGIFVKGSSRSLNGMGGLGDYVFRRIGISLSRSNQIFGRAAHVQPQTQSVVGFYKTAYAY